MPSITWAYAVLSATGLLLLLWTFNCRIGLPTTIEQQDEVMAQQSALPVTDRALYDGSQLVMVAATNSAFMEWALNWAMFCARLDVPYLVIAFDAEAAAALHMHGIPVHDASTEPGVPSLPDIRMDFAVLRQMMYLKIDISLQLMQQHHWQAVLLSDTDVAWLRHPLGLLEMYPQADMLVATDCLSQKAVDERRKDVPRCGTVPEAQVWADWNSGVVLFRNTSPALAAVRDWRDQMAPGTPATTADGWLLDDQQSLRLTLDLDSTPFQSGDAVWDDTGTLLTFRRQAVTMPLPPLVVAGGHVAFEQRLPELLNARPFAVHATFQSFQGNLGKKARFQENLLWLLHPPEYFTGKFLTYDNMVEVWISHVADVWKRLTGRAMVLFHKHVLAAAFQLQVLAEALEAAYALQRVLVPPRFVCYCWKDVSQMVDQLHTCSAIGTDKQPPFFCNMDAFINVEILEQYGYMSLLRYPNFLKHDRIAAMVSQSSINVLVYDSFSSSTSAATSNMIMTAVGQKQPVLPVYATDMQLLQALKKHKEVGVVFLGGLAPGWMTGLSNATSQAAVQAAVEQMADQGWCCLTAPVEGQNQSHAEVVHQKPQIGTAKVAARAATVSLRASLESASAALLYAMTAGFNEWQPADNWFRRPGWCDQDGFLTPFNKNVSHWAQHPCSYLSQGVVERLDMQLLKDELLQALRRVHQARVLMKDSHVWSSAAAY